MMQRAHDVKICSAPWRRRSSSGSEAMLRSSDSIADASIMLVSGAPLSVGSAEHAVRTGSEKVAGMRIGARGDGRVAGGLAERRGSGWRSRTGMRHTHGDRGARLQIRQERGGPRRVENGA